jgi:predicted YcjX-like family ATPase
MTHPTTHTPDELDDLIIQEKLQVALELQHDAWAESAADGIEPEIIADAAMITAIRETVRALGEDQAEALGGIAPGTHSGRRIFPGTHPSIG